jgi:hypothetical protein
MSALEDDTVDIFNVVIGWDIIASAFVTARVLLRKAVLQNSTCRLQSSFPPLAQEKSCSHVEQKMYISPFFHFPKQGNMPL